MSTTARPVPVDAVARERARRDHGTSFVIEAGAGTGKTTLLIDRIEALLRAGTVRLDQIAAVTFTENAATTMKLRLRERLEKARLDPAARDEERQRAAAALETIERAQISTIHALCAAILGERPLECGVVPGFRPVDDAESELLFAQAWEAWLTDALVEGHPAVMEALDEGIPLEGEGYGERASLRGLARTLVDQRDLRPLVADVTVDAEAWRRELAAVADRARELASAVADGDTLAPRLAAIPAFVDEMRALSGIPLARRLAAMPTIPRNYGHKQRWASPELLAEARGIAGWTSEVTARWKAALSASLHGRVVAAVGSVVLRYESAKRERGMLDFVDLLVKTRDALRGRPDLREYFRRRFPVLMIDEFQDTDPLQVEIARYLAGDTPGGLVVVGDAKQSIYRFRRAEVAQFRAMAEEARAGGGRAVLSLTQNFRSRPAILRFVNRAFAELIQPSVELGQPAYEPVSPSPGLGDTPSVIALRFEAPFAEKEELLRAEAAAITRLIASVAAGEETVRDPATGIERASVAGDVMVLCRRLSKVRFLEEALDAAGLRFTVEGGKSFFDRQEVNEVLAVLRAIDDPSDKVSLVAALRSSFFGVSDREIASYALSGGILWMGDADESLPGGIEIAPALAVLDALHKLRTRVSVPALIERLFDETRILAALTGSRRGEAQVSNLEKIVALARKAYELRVLTLRGFTRLLAERIGSAREEPDLPSTRPGDRDTVRILSIHKAKGLEAPVVVLYDSDDGFYSAPSSVTLWDQGLIAVGFRAGCQPPDWEQLVKAESARSGAEALRLLYVACTRARDLLVIPRPPEDARTGSFWRDLVKALPAASDVDVRVVDADTLALRGQREAPIDFRSLSAADGGDAIAVRWTAAREGMVKTASRRPFVPISAGRVAARTAPPPVLAAGEAGGGRDFGSLVHRILEWIPLDAPERAGPMAEALAPSFGLDPDAARRAGDAARRALALPVMQRARAASRVWRELPVWLPQGTDLVEGVVDLVFEEDGALVVVDYKTDHIAPEQALAQAAHHAPQLQLYGRALAVATGTSVRDRLVLFTALGESVAV
jgi:ATP-dependent helicase/nuclease subunit A